MPRRNLSRAVCSARRSAAHCLVESLEFRRLFSGVTLITHGLETSAGLPAWVSSMGAAVDSRAAALGMTHSDYQIKVTKGSTAPVISTTLIDGSPKTETGETVILLDWSSVSGLSNGYSTTTVANSLYTYLTSAAFTSTYGSPLASAHLQLIGHSRGAELVTQLAAKVPGTVDQVTLLDPHPVSSLGDPSTVVLPGNISFVDNYYKVNDFTDTLQLTPSSGPVTGAYNRKLNEDVLDNGGYSGIGGEHSDVHLWYYGTVNLSTTANDGSASVPTTWYSTTNNMGPRNAVGFAWTYLGGQARPAALAAAATTTSAQLYTVQFPTLDSASPLGGASAVVDNNYQGNTFSDTLVEPAGGPGTRAHHHNPNEDLLHSHGYCGARAAALLLRNF